MGKLKATGFHYVLIGIGIDKNSGIKLAGENHHIYQSLSFLRDYNHGFTPNMGKHVAVIGACNTAMDCARAALRIPDVEEVTIIYRCSKTEMLAWPEEYEEALADGVKFMFLAKSLTFCH